MQALLFIVSRNTFLIQSFRQTPQNHKRDRFQNRGQVRTFRNYDVGFEIPSCTLLKMEFGVKGVKSE